MKFISKTILAFISVFISAPLLGQPMHLIKLDFPDVGTRSTEFRGVSLELVIENMKDPKLQQTKLLYSKFNFKRPKGSPQSSFLDSKATGIVVGDIPLPDLKGELARAIVIGFDNPVAQRVVIYPEQNIILLLKDRTSAIPYPASYDSLNAKRIYALKPVLQKFYALPLSSSDPILKPDSNRKYREPIDSPVSKRQRCERIASRMRHLKGPFSAP